MKGATRRLADEDLRWFACPVCHSALSLQGDVVVCAGCSRRYPVVDGIPVLLATRALPERNT